MFSITADVRLSLQRNVLFLVFAGILLCVGVLSAYGQDQTRTSERISAENDLSKMYKGSYALLIGASKYQNNAWKELPGVRDDIAAVETALKAQGFEITKVLDPTSSQLRDAFNTFINKYGRNTDGRLLLYFAGHGHTIKTSYGGELGYIVPVDAPDSADEEDFKSVAMTMKQIEIYAEQINSKHALFVFDSCFSGSVFDTGLKRGAVGSLIWDKVSKPVREILTSGSAYQQVPDKSVFRQKFIAAINGEGDMNNDGYVTGAELKVFIEQAVADSESPTIPQFGTVRNPYLRDGDFVFIVPGSKRPAKTVAAPIEAEYQMPDSLSQAIALYTGTSGTINEPKAKQLFIDTSSRGDALATMWIARHHFLGRCGFQQNEDNAQKIAKTVIDYVKDLAQKGNAEAMFLMGDAYQSGLGVDKDYAQAVIWLNKAIVKGSPMAMNNLGVMYGNGEGLPKDDVQAMSLFRLAAEKQYPMALNNVGWNYKNGLGVAKDYAQALSFFNQAAEKGSSHAMSGLGEMYLNGEGVAKDADQAIKWYTKAAENGHTYSLLVLARLYRDGKDTQRDMTKAVKWYEKSAEAGDAFGIQELANLYLDGAEGMTKDASQVIPLFKRLADKGIPIGLAFLGWAYENGKGVAADGLRASIYYQQAADKADKYSIARLGKFYSDGKFVPQDFAKAEKYFRQMIDSGFPQAEVGLGEMYEKGRGVTQSYQQAIALYSKVAYPTGPDLDGDAQVGNAEAQFALGRVYESGSEAVRDMNQAIRWYRRAAFRNSKEAMERLAVIYETGKGVEKNVQFAEMWRKNAKGSVKRFTVPCEIDGRKVPFNVFIMEEYPPDEDNPVREEAERILTDHGAKVPVEVTDSFKRLLKIARENKVSFPELCVYALNAASDTKKDPKK